MSERALPKRAASTSVIETPEQSARGLGRSVSASDKALAQNGLGCRWVSPDKAQINRFGERTKTMLLKSDSRPTSLTSSQSSTGALTRPAATHSAATLSASTPDKSKAAPSHSPASSTDKAKAKSPGRKKKAKKKAKAEAGTKQDLTGWEQTIAGLSDDDDVAALARTVGSRPSSAPPTKRAAPTAASKAAPSSAAPKKAAARPDEPTYLPADDGLCSLEVPDGYEIAILVEHCVAERPSAHLKGSAAKYAVYHPPATGHASPASTGSYRSSATFTTSATHHLPLLHGRHRQVHGHLRQAGAGAAARQTALRGRHPHRHGQPRLPGQQQQQRQRQQPPGARGRRPARGGGRRAGRRARGARPDAVRPRPARRLLRGVRLAAGGRLRAPSGCTPPPLSAHHIAPSAFWGSARSSAAPRAA